MMRVVNLKIDQYDVYIGRGSVFGNPYRIGSDGDRAEVIRKYEEYARGNVALLKAIKELPKDSVLGCYCKPQACHGDIIIKLRKELDDA
jgi:hypothetical protein